MPTDTEGVLPIKSNSRDPAGIRTQDPYIKSVLLYQLSYGILLFLKKRTQTAFVFVEMFSLIAVQNYDFN